MLVGALNNRDSKSNNVINSVTEIRERDSESGDLAPLAIEEISEGIEVFTLEEESSSPDTTGKPEKDQDQKLLKRRNSRLKHFSFRREHSKENQLEKEVALNEPSSRLRLHRSHKKNTKVAPNDAPLKILVTKRRHYQAKRYLKVKNRQDAGEAQTEKDEPKRQTPGESSPQPTEPDVEPSVPAVPADVDVASP